MLNFCIGAYLFLVIPVVLLLWTALIAAKEADRKIIDRDIKNKSYSSAQDSLHIAELI